MDFLKNLGFDPVMLGAQILNFLIIFFLLKRFLYKPVLGMLKKRQDTIADGIKQAEKAQETLEKTIEQEKKILTKAQTEAKLIIEEARIKSLEVSKEIEENTKKDTEKMISQAKEVIGQETIKAEGKLTQKISVIAADLLTKALEGVFDEKQQKQILDKTLSKIKNKYE